VKHTGEAKGEGKKLKKKEISCSRQLARSVRRRGCRNLLAQGEAEGEKQSAEGAQLLESYRGFQRAEGEEEEDILIRKRKRKERTTRGGGGVAGGRRKEVRQQSALNALGDR